MKKNLKKTCAKVTALAMAFAMLASAVPAQDADAKAKKPKLSTKKVTVKVKKTKKVKIKNTKGIKKTTWSVKSKKIAKLSKKKKTSVTIKGVKAGKTTVTAKVKVKKKTYKLKASVTVTKATVNPTPKVTVKPTTKPTTAPTGAPTTDTPTGAPSNAPSGAPSNAPSGAPSNAPTATPTPAPPVKPDGNEYTVSATEANVWDGINNSGGEYYADLEFDNEGAIFTSTDQYNSCVAFLMNPDGRTVDVSDFDTLEIDLVCAYDRDEPQNSTYHEAAFQVWYTAATGYYGKKDVAYSGATGTDAARVWTFELSELGEKGIQLNDLKAIGVTVQDGAGKDIKVKSFTFKKNADSVSGDVPKKVTIKQTDNLNKVLEGAELPLVATVTNKNSMVIKNAEVEWSVDDNTKATVSEDGVVTGVASGNVTVTASVKVADGADPVTATYAVQVYNNDPASIAIKVDGNHACYTVDELLAKNEGLTVSGVKLNANGDELGATTSQNITVKDAGDTGAVIADGVLTATAAGTMTLELATTDGFDAVTKEITVVNGTRVDMTVDKVLDSSQSAFGNPGSSHATTFEIVNDVLTMSGAEDNLGFEVVFTLPENKTVADYKGVRFAYSADADALDETKGNFQNKFVVKANPDWSESSSTGNGLACGWGGEKTLAAETAGADGIATLTFGYDYDGGSFTKTSNKIRFGVKVSNWNGAGKISISDIILLAAE